MLAQIVGWKEWKDKSGFPMLVIKANRSDQREDLEALQMIEEALSGVVGDAYGKKLCSTQKGSGQHGLFTVDLSAVLIMLRAAQEDTIKKAAANAWIHNWLKDKVKPQWLPSVKKESKNRREYTCRCGMIFSSKSSPKKAKSKWMKHQKRCAVLKELSPLFERGKNLLGRLADDSKTEEPTNQAKTRKAKGSRHKQPTSKHKEVVRRTKARRPKRHHHKG